MKPGVKSVAMGVLWLVLLSLSAPGAGCKKADPPRPLSAVEQALAKHAANVGSFGEWIKSPSLDVRVNIAKAGETEIPQVDFQNRFSEGVDIVPCVLRAVYADKTVVEVIEKCDGSGIVVAPNRGLTGFARITPKELPPAGKLEAVDLVYGRLGKIPEEAWPRFSVTKSGPTTRPL